MRWIVCFLLLAAALTPSAWAQMAAPALIPGSASATDPLAFRGPSLVPLNPAVMPWSGHSAAGGGIARGEYHIQGLAGSASNIEANYAGMQRVYDEYAWGVQGMWASQDGSSGTATFDVLTLAASRRWGNWLAGGLGYHSFSEKDQFGGVDFTDMKAGASFRFLDNWFLGALAGQEKYENKNSSGGGSGWSSTQPMAGYGVGFRSDGSWQLHFELSAIDYGEAKNDKKDDIFSTKKSWIVAEVAHDPWVAGLTLNHAVEDQGKAEDPATYIADGYELTLGTLPQNGFSLLFQYAYTHAEFGINAGFKTKIVSTTRGLSLLYIY